MLVFLSTFFIAFLVMMGIFSTSYTLLDNYTGSFWTLDPPNFYLTSLGWIIFLIFVITFALSVVFSHFRPLKYVPYVLAVISGICLELVIYGISLAVVD
ncbi:MAG: hypothetical protein HWN65_09780 [Candidatus Helarchaeota archaeon]|nr:hypothetical protein [Candidatus Helarchaeota archaeon]